jgi:hypothetical protein
LSFGEYPAVSLVDARGKREETWQLLREKKDPAVEKKLQEMEKLKEVEATFESVAREWHQSRKPGWVPHHAADVIESLEVHVFPEIGNLPIRTLGPSTIWKVLKKIQERPAVETAHRVKQRISATGRRKPLSRHLEPITTTTAHLCLVSTVAGRTSGTEPRAAGMCDA